MKISAELFRLLGDPQRLRILRMLAREKLNVSELTEIFGIAQSGISRHLRMLREVGLIQEDRERGWTYYSVAPAQFSDGLLVIWPALNEQLDYLDGVRQDDARLQETLRQRQEDFREEAPVNVPGRSWAAWARTLSFIAPRLVVADLGCGEGYLTLEVARWAKKVIAVDRSRKALKRAQQMASRRESKNIEWRHATIEKLAMKNESMDIVLMSQVLHCLKDPAKGLAQAYRILKPGGKILIQDLRSHNEEWVQTKFGHSWLGFQDRHLENFLKAAGFQEIHLETGAKRRGDPFTVLIGCARKRNHEKRLA
jgi:2-polyprenyl-3-methyl-5-hydroxy-6-metoxy-1,4-benzoquinol methylase